MTFEPQVPDWGKKLVAQNLDQLVIYHDWLCNTGINQVLLVQKANNLYGMSLLSTLFILEK